MPSLCNSHYSEFPVQKIKLALGDKGYCRLNQIQFRHFYQTGQKTGLREQDMDNIFSDLTARMDDAIAEAAALTAGAGMPESTSGPILDGVCKRARMIRKE